MKKQELRKLIREEIQNLNPNKDMGYEIESTHYLELLKDLKETNDINTPEEVNMFIASMKEFITMLKNNEL